LVLFRTVSLTVRVVVCEKRAPMITIDNPETLFKRWFAAAIFALQKNLEDGDGAIADLMVVLPLYERYIYITLQRTGDPKPAFYELMANKLELDNANQAEIFWTTFRHGFCHTGMPLEVGRRLGALPKVGFNGDYPKLPEFRKTPDDKPVIVLDPWKFAHHVRKIYKSDPSLLDSHPDAPLVPIYIIAEFELRSSEA
jgi:hypothetical protein